MALTRCAAVEGADHGVRVNAVAPSIAMHPFLARVTIDDLLDTLTAREAYSRAAEPQFRPTQADPTSSSRGRGSVLLMGFTPPLSA